MTTENLIKEYKKVKKHYKDVLADLKKYPDDKFLKSQLQITRKYKKELEIQLDLKGLNY